MADPQRATRGTGLLEGFLSRKRAAMALRLLHDRSRTDGRILDIGCGSHPFFLLECGFTHRYGVDQVFHEDGERIDGIPLSFANLEHTPRLDFPDDSFDAVTMLAVFEHIDPPVLTPLLQEIRRVLTPGGRLVLTTPAAWTDPLLRAMARLGLLSREEIDEHKGSYDHDSIRAYLADAGFHDSRIRTGTFELGMNLWVTADA